MTLFDSSLELLVRLEAARSDDASEDLLARGRAIAVALDEASEYLEHAAAFAADIGVDTIPNIDQKQASQAIGAFRAGLSRYGPPGMQHQPATNLVNSAKTQRDRTVRWVKDIWNNRFLPFQADIERQARNDLVGTRTLQVTAASRAATLRAMRGLDPVREPGELMQRFGDSVSAWLTGIDRCGSQLREAIDAIDRERGALSAEVREVLTRAASDNGLSLSEMTPELLSRLREAGLLEQLVVRRK